MSIGLILLIVLMIVLLGGFSGWGGGPFYGHRLLWRRRTWIDPRDRSCSRASWEILTATKSRIY